LAEAGGKISSLNVHKDYRKDPKPRGYAGKMTEIIGETPVKKAPAKKKPAAAKKSTKKAQTLAEELGLENIDPEDPRIKAVKAMFKPVAV
jgi:hypothetical protein